MFRRKPLGEWCFDERKVLPKVVLLVASCFSEFILLLDGAVFCSYIRNIYPFSFKLSSIDFRSNSRKTTNGGLCVR